MQSNKKMEVHFLDHFALNLENYQFLDLLETSRQNYKNMMVILKYSSPNQKSLTLLSMQMSTILSLWVLMEYMINLQIRRLLNVSGVLERKQEDKAIPLLGQFHLESFSDRWKGCQWIISHLFS